MKQRRNPTMAYIFAVILVCLGPVKSFGEVGTVKPALIQGQLVSLGILVFQDDSGTNAPPELGQKLAQDLQQRLAVTYKDVLPRVLSTGVNASSVKTMTVEQIAALGKQNGVKFVVRGGVLALVVDPAGTETRINAQLYAEIISVEAASIVNTVRAEGAGAQTDKLAAFSTVEVKSDQFGGSALGQALMTAVGQLTENIHQAVMTSATTQETTTQTVATATEADTAQTEAAAAADVDSELQQLIAQAESLLSSGANAGTETISAVQQSLEALKTALASKAGLLEQGQDTAQADQTIAQHKEELQATLNKLTEEAATSASTSTGDEQQSGEKKGFMTRINEFAGEALGLLQKIQEMRAALLGFSQEQSGQMAAEGTPYQESTEDVSGEVTEDGVPVADATVTDQDSGTSTQTDINGAYTLHGLMSGKLVKLLVSTKTQKKMSAHVQVFHGRANLADFQLSPKSAGAGTTSAYRILPSTVVVGKGSNVAGTGVVRGVVVDAAGRPVPRAIVSLKGVAVARTNSQGQYVFLNVPAGVREVSVSQSGLKARAAQVKVMARKSSDANIKFGTADRIASLSTKGSLIQPGASTTLRGTVLDNANRPLPGAKVSVIQSNGVVSVFSGRDGSFELRNLKPTDYRLTVYKVGFESTSQSLALRSGSVERRDLKLKPQASPLIASLLRNQAARPTIVRPPARRDNPVTSKAGLTDAGPGNVKKDNGIPPFRETQGYVPGLTKGQMMGRVTNAASGNPLPDASVSISGQPSVKTDAQGNYALTALNPGSYQVSVKRNGYTSEARTITIRAGSPTRQDFALKSGRSDERDITSTIKRPPLIIGGLGARPGQLSGQVTDAAGKPITGATVAIVGQPSVFTDPAGRFAIRNLAPGTYRISISKIGFGQGQGAVAVRGGETATANFKLNPIARPSIRLR